jgi:hypothetical protein
MVETPPTPPVVVQKALSAVAHQVQLKADRLVTADESERLTAVSLQVALREQPVLQPEEPPQASQMELESGPSEQQVLQSAPSMLGQPEPGSQEQQA